MENASKALLIAGAILICILLIAIGMYVYNSASATVDSAVNQMSQQEKDIYNAKIKSYIGDTIKGSEVKSMIDNIISQNQENANKTGKFISISTAGIKNYTVGGNLDNACANCNYYGKATCQGATSNAVANWADSGGDGKNTEDNVKAATAQMTTLKSKINSSKTYSVTAESREGVYVCVMISGGGN